MQEFRLDSSSNRTEKTTAAAAAPTAAARWRLVLGRFAETALPGALGGDQSMQQADRLLDYLYGREYRGRGVRERDPERSAGLGESELTVPEWVAGVRDLFPKETVEVLERHALDRYEMTELVTDPEVLEKLEPNWDLLKSILAFKGMMGKEVLSTARRIVKKVVEDLTRRLTRDVRRVLWGKLNRRERSPIKLARNLDVRRTIRSNLKHWDADSQRLVLEHLHFFSRVKNHMPWHVIMAVDCSGSMLDSVIHSAVMAGIFNALPALKTSLIAFDTQIVDFSDRVDDPVEILMSVQLGGGTNIAAALRYCENLVQSPTRTIVLLVTDFFEGASPPDMIATIKRLRGAGVRVLGLAALDAEASPAYDKEMARRCADAGAEVAALTPLRLAEWLSKVLS